MEELANIQSSTGRSISQLFENFKRERAERRTIAITGNYSKRLEELWTYFCTTDRKLEDLQEANLEHPYFAQDYRGQVENEYEAFRLKIQQRLHEPYKEPATMNIEAEDTTKQLSNGQQPIGETQTPDLKGMDGEQLKHVRQADAIFTALRRIIKATQHELSQPHSRAFYLQKLKTIDSYWAQIATLHTYIVANPDQGMYDTEKYTDMEDLYQAMAINLQEKLDQHTGSSSSKIDNVKLPKITLPSFDGNYAKWKQFKDLFTQLIHVRTISSAEKMYYLKANLVGEPSRLITHLQATDENYSMAWKILIERYDNPRTIVSTILTELLSQTSLTIESAGGIKKLHDTSKECLLALQNMGIQIKEWDTILLHLLLQKLDKDSRRLYEQSLKSSRELQTMNDFFKFLESRFQMLEAITIRDERKKASTFTASTKAHHCPVCNAEHKVFKCNNFLYLPIEGRIRLVRRHQLCENCLKADHKTRQCPSRGCLKCNKRHNTLLHLPQEHQTGSFPHTRKEASTSFQQARPRPPNQSKAESNTSKEPTIIKNVSLNASTGSQILLATAVVKVISTSGLVMTCRVLLDSGSQLHFICERLVQALGLKRHKFYTPISGIGGIETTAKFETSVTIRSRLTNFSATINAVILPKISDFQPASYVKTTSWNIPSNIQLADPAFQQPQAIDMLLGADLYFQLLDQGQIKLHNDLPRLQNTQLGWIIGGRVPNAATGSYNCHIATQPSFTVLEKQLQRFWELEQHDSPSRYATQQEHECEQHFQKTFQRHSSGKFIVKLPFQEPPAHLGSSREMATKRFYALERKLEKNPEVKKEYVKFIEEYQALGHMQPIATDKLPAIHYYMPHHCVIKPDSSTTKLRVVFDASAKTSSGKSLNDLLMVGPTVQSDLFSILTTFRMHKYVMTADICKMYRQIEVDAEDRYLQLILWRTDRNKPLQTYQLNTVTYGTASAPFLATRCLNQLALLQDDIFPKAAKAIQNDTYVDDILTGADSMNDILALKNELIKMLQQGGFELRKFCANHTDILRDLSEDYKEKMLLIQENEVVKALGLIWQPKDDSFQYQVTHCVADRITKRTVLSEVTRIFDPLGLIGPVTLVGKLFVQELWKTKCSWDDELPTETKEKWKRFKAELSMLHKLRIPRHVLLSNPEKIQLHAFSDSSEVAYGCCCYIRSINSEGKIRVRLQCSKSRLAPVKSTTLARLELCAAVLMVELVERLQKRLHIPMTDIYYYTDSTIVLSWIAAPSYTWTTFVANRVEKIQQLTTSQQWKHIEGRLNPADIISRGKLPEELANTTLWFKGPEFLSQPEQNWPETRSKLPAHIPDARPKRSVLITEIKQYSDLVPKINHKNSFTRLQRIIAYCFRFLNNCRTTKASRSTETLSMSELDIGLHGIIRNVQRTAFRKEYVALQGGNQLDKNNPLQCLNPYLDNSTGILRVGGRLRYSDLSTEAKNQILLPKGHKLSELIFLHLHKAHMHAAAQTLIAIARQRFWVMDARRLARQTIYRCIRCFRFKPHSIDQIMGNLPKERVRPARPFHTTGVDFCGPISIHYRIRGKAPTKAYIALFVCFTTKAVHLELVSDLSTLAFLNALKRFIARRGLCATIFCDNATNFVGARSELKGLKEMFSSQELQSSLSQLCAEKHIEWKPIPPRSPHFGGLWESAIKSAKGHLVKHVGNANLTYEELHTVIVQIEAILNSRPLTPMSSDPNDLEALTPGHFLTGSPLTSFAEPEVNDQNINRLTRFQRIQHIQQTVWKRWSTEYLQELQARLKWKTTKPNLKAGTMVLIKDKNLPPLKWALGRIVETFDGSDDLTRVVNVKTASGIFKRAIHNLCPLPEEEHNYNQKKCDDEDHDSSNKKENCLLVSQSILNGEPPTKKLKLRRPFHPLRGRFLPINSNWNLQNTESRATTREDISSSSRSEDATHTTNSCDTTIPETRTLRENQINNIRQSNKPTRATRSGAITALKTLMLTSLILPILGNATSEVEVRPFTNHPGLFFESLGQAQLVNSEWNIIAYYDLGHYWTEIIGIRKCIEEITRLCEVTIIKKYHCLEILTQLKHQLAQIEDNNEILYKRSASSQLRRIRSPLNLVGNIANKLFGILDSTYANHIEGEIERVRTNEEYLLQLFKNQTSILDSTANIMKAQEENIKQQFQMIQDHIAALTHYVNDAQREQQAAQTFSSLSILTLLVLQNFQRIQTALLGVLTDLHNKQINPLLLTPMQLRDQITLIKEYIPSTLTIPGNGKDGGLLLYNLMTAEARVTDSYILFNLKIPLQYDEYFELFKVIPIPTPYTDGFILIKPSSEYLIVSLHRDRYYPLSQIDLDKCMHLHDEQYLCTQHHPIYNLRSDVSRCELDMLNHHQSLSPSCRFQRTKKSKFWIQLQTPNNWLYSLDNETTFNVVCNKGVIPKTLSGSGTLSLRPDCSIKQTSMTITGHGRYQSKLTSAFVPSINISQLLDKHLEKNDTLVVPTSPELHLRSNDVNLEAISHKLRELKAGATLPGRLNIHDIHQYSISYLILTGLVLGLSYIAYRRWKKNTSTQLLPTPISISYPIPTRRTQTTANEDFVLHNNSRGEDGQTSPNSKEAYRSNQDHSPDTIMKH